MQSISQLLEHPSLLAYFSGASNYTWLQFRNGDRRLLSKPISYFEEQLPHFIRVHKTALINPASVADIQAPTHSKMPGMVRMQDGTELPVSRRRWDDVMRLLQNRVTDVSLAGAAPDDLPDLEPEEFDPYLSPPLVVMAVMTGDALLLTRECIGTVKLPYVLQHVEQGASLATSLLFNPAQQRPALIILDARTNRADRFVTLRALKSHPELRAIPVVWLASPDEDPMQAYTLDANSVVAISSEPAAFVRAVEQVCRYWLTVVQLPPESTAG